MTSKEENHDTSPFADNPSEGLIPQSITPLCVSRLNGWIAVITYLINYLKVIVEQEKRLSEFQKRASNELRQMLDSEGMRLFDSKETFRSMLKNISETNQKKAAVSLSLSSNIEEQLLPILNELLGQLKLKISDSTNSWSSFDNEMVNDLEKFCRLKSHVRNALVRQQWKGGEDKTPEMPRNVPKDPWLANQALQRHIDECYQRQEKYRQHLRTLKDDFSAFEAVIVQNLKVSISSFFEWQKTGYSQQEELISNIQAIVQNLNPEMDWTIFEAKHPNRFIKDIPLVEPSSLTYDGYDDPIMVPVKQGKILRKDGISMWKRIYKENYAVLTKSNFLHSYPALEKGQKFNGGVPELSMDLMEFNLEPLMMNEKEPEEISFVGKTSGMFAREVKHKFKMDTMEESAEWWGILNEQMKSYKGKRIYTAIQSDKEKMADINNVHQKDDLFSEGLADENYQMDHSTSRNSELGITNNVDFINAPTNNFESNFNYISPVESFQDQRVVTPTVADISNFGFTSQFQPQREELTQEELILSKMTVSERMDYIMNKKTTAANNEFTAQTNDEINYHSGNSSNPWKFDAGDEPGW